MSVLYFTKVHTSRLTVHKPTLAGDRLLACTYHVGEKHYLNTYEFPRVPITDPDSPLAKKLLQWVAIVTSFELFSVDYFDELVCDFPITPEDKAFFEKRIY